MAERVPTVKVVVVGDGTVGKTCLCNALANKPFTDDYQATVFDNLSQVVTIQGQTVELQVMDTAGQEAYQHIRFLGYENTDCFMVCFSVANETTFKNITNTWVEEIRSRIGNAKFLLVGTKADLRGKNKVDGGNQSQQEVNPKKAKNLVKSLGLHDYVEVSAKFDAASCQNAFYRAAEIALNLKRNEKVKVSRLSKIANMILCRS